MQIEVQSTLENSSINMIDVYPPFIKMDCWRQSIAVDFFSLVSEVLQAIGQLMISQNKMLSLNFQRLISVSPLLFR